MPAHISKITVARLFNLGDYEHARYELTADLTELDHAPAIMRRLTEALEAIDPRRPDDVLDDSEITAKEETLVHVRAQTDEEWAASYESRGRTRAEGITLMEAEILRDKTRRDEWARQHNAALELLDDLGGEVRRTP